MARSVNYFSHPDNFFVRNQNVYINDASIRMIMEYLRIVCRSSEQFDKEDRQHFNTEFDGITGSLQLIDELIAIDESLFEVSLTTSNVSKRLLVMSSFGVTLIILKQKIAMLVARITTNDELKDLVQAVTDNINLLIEMYFYLSNETQIIGKKRTIDNPTASEPKRLCVEDSRVEFSDLESPELSESAQTIFTPRGRTKKPALKKHTSKNPASEKPASKEPASEKPAIKKHTSEKPASKEPVIKKRTSKRATNYRPRLGKERWTELLFQYCDEHQRTPKVKTVYHGHKLGAWFFNVKHRITNSRCQAYIDLSKNKYVKLTLDYCLTRKD